MSVPLPVSHCPSSIREVADEFKDFMTTTQYRSFTATLCAAVFGISGYCNVNRFILFANSVSSISNFFNSDSLWGKLNRRHRRRLIRLLKDLRADPARYMWVLDDTLLGHSGKSIWGAYHWKDHCSGKTILAHKLLVLGILDRYKKVLVPVYWDIMHRDLSNLTEEDIPQVHEKAWVVALRRLDEAMELGFPCLPLSSDSWFAGEELFDALIERGIDYEIEIKCNRKIAHHGRKRVNMSVADFFASKHRSPVYTGRIVKYGSEAVVRLKDSKNKTKVVAIANKRKSDNFAYYASNRLNWNASKIWGLARDRWGIEVQFRDLKQLFTLGKAAVQSRNAVETAISIAAIALTVIRLQQIDEDDTEGNKWTRPRPAGSIVQEMIINSFKQLIAEISTSANNSRIIQRLKTRLSYENLTNKPAEYRRFPIMPFA